MRPANAFAFLIVLLASILLAGMVWIAGDILALFLVAFILAYLFDPLAAYLTRHRIPRTGAALIVTGGLVIIFGVGLAVLGPIVYSQLSGILKSAQTLLKTVTTDVGHVLTPYFPSLHELGLGGLIRPGDQPIENVTVPVAASVLRGGMAFATTVGIILLVPVVLFYLLKDWPRMMDQILLAIPPRKRLIAKELGREVDAILSAFLHGQARVCLCVAILYAGGLMAIGLNYALVIGLVSGALKFLPYIGVTVAYAISISAAVAQSGWDGFLIFGITAIFLLIELLDMGILSPRLIGSRVQLHPALVIFAILFGAKLLGIIGIFIAIPAFAVGRVLVSFWLRQQTKGHPAGSPATARALRRS